MASAIDPTKPVDGIPAVKADLRANLLAAKNEIEALQAASSGLLGRFTAEQYGAVGNGVADDWQALTNALAAAGSTPVILRPGAVYAISQSLVVPEGGFDGLQPGNVPAISALNPGTHAIIRLNPAGQGRRFVLRHLSVSNGLYGIHGNPDMGATIWRHSIFEDIYIGGAGSHGFFFEGLGAIGVTFNNIEAETCGGHGIYFKGDSILNAAQIINPRAVLCGGDGLRFENTAATENPALLLAGGTSEYNTGAGFRFLGYNAHMSACHMEGNDFAHSGTVYDLTIGSSTPGSVISRITATSCYWGPSNHPQNHRIGHAGIGGTQHLILINPKFNSTSDLIEATNMRLLMFGAYPKYDVKVNGYSGAFHNVLAAGWNLMGSIVTGAGGVSTGLKADPSPQGGCVIKVLAARAAGAGGGVAEYFVQRNPGGTVTPTFVAGTDFLTFSVDGDGEIVVTCASGEAHFCVYGF